MLLYANQVFKTKFHFTFSWNQNFLHWFPRFGRFTLAFLGLSPWWRLNWCEILSQLLLLTNKQLWLLLQPRLSKWILLCVRDSDSTFHLCKKNHSSKIPFHPLHGINLFASLENNNLSFCEEWKPNPFPLTNSPPFSFPWFFVWLVLWKIRTDVFFRSRGPFLVLFFLFLHFQTMLLALSLNYNSIEW